jgi:glyoxylase-like metal-dependent hydrolase (beta-lactamase superfamily II)
VCLACGVQAAEGPAPAACAICADERQFVGVGGHGGQRWATPDELTDGHRNEVAEEEPGLVGLVTRPRLGIGQRALLVRAPAGNLLWDCLSVVDGATVDTLQELGGVAAIALSHPHFYGACVAWSERFGGAPIYIHEDDAAWAQRPSGAYRFWAGEEVEPVPGLRLLRLGGHFPGSSAVLWPEGAGGRGALLSSDTVQVVPDRRFVSVMWSYPNHVPVDAGTLDAIAGRLEGLAFDRIYGAFPGNVVRAGGKEAMTRSFARYRRHLQG